MARTLTFVPTATPNSVASLALEDIPEDVRKEVEEIYATLKTNPNGRIRARFDDKAELNTFVTQVTSYCNLRPAGPIRFRKSPTKGLPDNEMDFRITEVQTENEKITEEVREATAKANEASGNAPAKKAAKKAA